MEKEAVSTDKKNKPPQNNLLMILILVAAVVTPALTTTIAVNAINAKLSKIKGAGIEMAGVSEGEAKEKEKEKAKEVSMLFYEPMEFLVNLTDTQVNHYLRATISVGYALVGEEAAKSGGSHGEGGAGPQPEIFKRLKAQEPVVRDLVISIVSAYSMEMLLSAKGKTELKEAIQERLRQQMADSNLTIYFTSFTLQ